MKKNKSHFPFKMMGSLFLFQCLSELLNLFVMFSFKFKTFFFPLFWLTGKFYV